MDFPVFFVHFGLKLMVQFQNAVDRELVFEFIDEFVVIEVAEPLLIWIIFDVSVNFLVKQVQIEKLKHRKEGEDGRFETTDL